MRLRFLLALPLLAALGIGGVFLAPPPSALAAQPTPSVRCDQATAELVKVRADLRAAEKAAAELLLQVNLNTVLTLEAKLGELLKIETPTEEQTKEIATLRDQIAKIRAVLDLRVKVAEAEKKRDRVCAPPSSSATPTPTPSQPPSSSATPSPAPRKDVYDCSDFPLEDGTTAQEMYDKDRSDPHKLDLDKDGKACEPEDRKEKQLSDSDIPSGGVETGNGVNGYPLAWHIASLSVVVVSLASLVMALKRQVD